MTTTPNMPRNQALELIAGLGDLTGMNDAALDQHITWSERHTAYMAELYGQEVAGPGWGMHQAARVIEFAMRHEKKRRCLP